MHKQVALVEGEGSASIPSLLPGWSSGWEVSHVVRPLEFATPLYGLPCRRPLFPLCVSAGGSYNRLLYLGLVTVPWSSRTSIRPSPAPCNTRFGVRGRPAGVAGHACLFSEAHMGKKLYVGNLSYDTDSSGLQQMFEPFGTVQSAQVVTDRETGRSRGFGFVEMGSGEQAQAAITALNGRGVDGRALTVNEARPREGRGGQGGNRRRY